MSWITYVIWRNIVNHILEPYDAPAAHIAHTRPNLIQRQQSLLRLASIDRQTRFTCLHILYNQILLALDTHANGLAFNCQHLVRHAHALHIKINPSGDIRVVTKQLMDCLPRELRMLQSITIESNEQCTHEELIEYDWATRLYLPVLATINVVYNSAVSPFPMLAPILARTIMQCADKQTGLVLNLRSAHNMAYTIVAPAWIDCAQMLTTLAFTNMDVIPSAMHAVRMCCKTLERLEFLHCSYEQFKHMVYDDKESPVEYPKLRYIRGALSQPMSSTFTVPHVFPRLERVHEACAFEWQNMGRVVPHLLVNTLMKIELPRLHELVVQTSRDMDLHLTNVPNLTCVRYYRPERLEPMDARNVVGQLGRLFMVRNLQYLRFGDHLPSLHITGNFRIACVCLEYLDVGTIMLSLSTTIHILQSLSMLHSLKCALSQAWTSHKAMLELNDCLSRSVRLIKVYVVGQAKGVTPVDEVVARLPMLTHVQVQEGARNMREFVERMKHEHRFEWSARVADRIHIETVNFT